MLHVAGARTARAPGSAIIRRTSEKYARKINGSGFFSFKTDNADAAPRKADISKNCGRTRIGNEMKAKNKRRAAASRSFPFPNSVIALRIPSFLSPSKSFKSLKFAPRAIETNNAIEKGKLILEKTPETAEIERGIAEAPAITATSEQRAMTADEIGYILSRIGGTE